MGSFASIDVYHFSYLMSYIQTTDLETALCKTAGSLAADPRALLAIQAAEAEAWKMTCLKFDAVGVTTVPTPLVGANAACLTGITAGKWRAYTWQHGFKDLVVDPFVSVSNVVIIPRGYDYTSATNCSNIKSFTMRDVVPMWRYSLQASHVVSGTQCYYNSLAFCDRACEVCTTACRDLGCVEIWVQADWTGETGVAAVATCGLPGSLKMAITGYAAELYNMYCCGKANIKSESVEGYTIVYREKNEVLDGFKSMINSYSVCSRI